jgi:hypothetical protein
MPRTSKDLNGPCGRVDIFPEENDPTDESIWPTCDPRELDLRANYRREAPSYKPKSIWPARDPRRPEDRE